ncbi:MAG: decaprenylphospho-beta-D-erythro-pentofuranosid-2-ulose 2-reductase [Acidimicrobiales bacterium]|jgi:decaprenylphospho-beta-D-erythro-pentofuranosid-2-ulose 2-reductase|nr:decaprenylphospho-beta-D-erythro-pentofuranosid-2-ulose 2-reductase [Acidimicrobiales bacterium]
MRDALGAVQSVLVLGGSSEIGLAITRRLVQDRCRTVVLGVREPDAGATRAAVDDLRRAGATSVEAVRFDACDTATHQAVLDDVFERFGDIDLVVVAFGVLGEQTDFDTHPAHAVEAVQANYVGAVSAGLVTADRFRQQGHGTLLVLSSVAAERPRRSNYVYGSSKAGLDAFAQGLGDALVGTGGRVVVVRPGFVHSRMTEGMAAQPFATTPDAVAEAVVAGLQKGREIIWAPGILRWVFAVMRHLPRPLWRIVSAR